MNPQEKKIKTLIVKKKLESSALKKILKSLQIISSNDYFRDDGLKKRVSKLK